MEKIYVIFVALCTKWNLLPTAYNKGKKTPIKTYKKVLSRKTCKRSFAHKYQTFDQNYIQCLIGHTKGPGKCVGLYRILQYSGFILVNRYTLGP